MRDLLSVQTAGLSLWLVVSLANIGWAQQESAPSLTMEETVKVALQNNPTLQAARHRVTGAEKRVSGAKAQPNPDVSVSPVIGSQEVDGGDGQLFVQQTIEISGRRTFRTRVARSELNATQADVRALERDLVRDVRSAYVDLLAALKIQELNESVVKLARSFRDAAQRQFDEGNAARREVVRMNVELARAETGLLNAQRDVQQRRAALNTLLGRDATVPVSVAGELKFESTAFTLEQAKETALRQRPEIQSAEAEVQARRAEVDLVRSERRPDLSLKATQSTFRSDPKFGVQVGLAFPLLDYGRIRSNVQSAQAAVAERESLLTQTKNLVLLDVTQSFTTLQAARLVVEKLQTEAVPRTEELVRMAQRGYQEGAFNLLEVLDAQHTLLATQTDYYQAIADHQKAVAELERAMGGDAYMK